MVIIIREHQPKKYIYNKNFYENCTNIVMAGIFTASTTTLMQLTLNFVQT